MTYYILVQAEITDEIPDLVENETNLVTLNCQAIGEPFPSIDWYFNNVMINASDTSNYNISDSLNETVAESSLLILNVQSFNVGTYTCHAQNLIGIDRSSGILTVNGKCILYIYFVCY